MEKQVYLVDNMVICSKAISLYLDKDFFHENVWVIDEVIYEARNSKQIELIKKLRHSIRAKECERLKQITVDCVEKYKILKLYEGCADAILLATALAINDSDEDQAEFKFEHYTPIIVTQENGIQAACDILDIKWLPQSSFIQIIKQSSNPRLPLGI